MDLNPQLIEEIVARVMEKLKELNIPLISMPDDDLQTQHVSEAYPPQEREAAKTAPPPVVAEVRQAVLSKRIITETDIKNLHADGVMQIHVPQHAILSDLAREYAHVRRIEIVRDNG